MVEAQNKPVFIYGLYDPRDGLLRYVGKTSRNPRFRFANHLFDSRGSHKANWCASLKALGFKPEMRILEETDESDWMECEKFWISTSRLAGFNLTNTTDGGDSHPTMYPEIRAKISMARKGYVPSLEARKAISEGNKAFHKTHPYSKERREAISKRHTGKIVSEETKRKLSEINKGNKNCLGKKNTLGMKHSPESIAKIRAWSMANHQILTERLKRASLIKKQRGNQLWLKL